MIIFDFQRHHMVERQLARRGIRAEPVLGAMRAVPREEFVSEEIREFTYEDSALPIEAGQTISQPYIVARMIEAADIGPGDRVLEIGTGSGYAAAVMSLLATKVFTIERQAVLADIARSRFQRLGYRNIETRTGDGTKGWPEEAPFDAILAAASGPAVPETWRRQLKIGGRLVMPIGDRDDVQRLILLTRTAEDKFEKEELGDVRFVPLIGSHGWQEGEEEDQEELEPEPETTVTFERSVPEQISFNAEILPEFDDPAFGRMFDRYKDKRVVLLGEASHGTSEFYRARAAITRRLVEEHGFRIVALEADYPDAAAIDRHVRSRENVPGAAEAPFRRFPTWMWRNTDFSAFVGWLREHNEARAPGERAGIYGLDLYNLAGSIRAVIDYLDQVDPEAAEIARERYGCLQPWQKEPQSYGRMAISTGYAACREPVVGMLAELLRKQLSYAARDGENFLDAAQNARLIQSAEAYYRAMYVGGAESWNLRDRHMFETLSNLLDAKGPDAKAVVWAHNSHIGDARATEMGATRGELNIGQLCRDRFGEEAALIGFGTHSGTVAAATDWDGPMEIKAVGPSIRESYERLSHDTGLPRFLLDIAGASALLRERLDESRLERFIGVIYRPESERLSHYMEASLVRQFDAWLWFDRTTAVTPLPTESHPGEEDTWPSGF